MCVPEITCVHYMYAVALETRGSHGNMEIGTMGGCKIPRWKTVAV